MCSLVRACVAGTVEAAHYAMQRGVGINLGGGFHHASRDHGHGFCVYNDISQVRRRSRVVVVVRRLSASAHCRRALRARGRRRTHTLRNRDRRCGACAVSTATAYAS